MKTISLEKIKPIRIHKNTIDDLLIEKINKIELINQFFLNPNIPENIHINSELHYKLNGYKNQDKKKSIFNDDFINNDQLIEKLVVSKLKCYYCRKNLLILYKNVRDELQWTLDRIDNKLGHSSDNTVISCLKCNLQKRTRNTEAFKFTKQLNIKKVY